MKIELEVCKLTMVEGMVSTQPTIEVDGSKPNEGSHSARYMENLLSGLEWYAISIKDNVAEVCTIAIY